MTVKEAAERMQIPVTALRWGLQQDAKNRKRGYVPMYPFGTAVKQGETWRYYIIPERLESYLNPSPADDAIKAIQSAAVEVMKAVKELTDRLGVMS